MQERQRRRLAVATLVMVSTGLVLAGCGGDSGTGPADDDGPATTPVSVSVTGVGGVPIPNSRRITFARRVSGSGGKTIRIDRIRVVVANTRARPSDATSCDGGQCVDFTVPTSLIDLPLADGVLTLESVNLENGTWDGLAVDLLAPAAGEDDEFLQDHPEFEGVSVRVEGSFEGEDFDLVTDVEASFLVDIDPPLMLDAAQGTANVTVELDFNDWFKDDDGALFDPATAAAGGQNESRLETRITNSIQAFQDNDRDGRPGSSGDGV